MADFPRIAPAQADTNERPYTPLSAPAVAALGLAILTAVVITGFGITALISRRPFLSGVPFLMAVASLIAAVAAKIHIAKSGGTRTGAAAANAALMITLLFGLSYGAYWFAIDFALRKQSEEFTQNFVKLLTDGEEEKAFRLTRPADQQKTLADDAGTIRRRYGTNELGVFTRSDLPRMLRTWKGKTEFELLGVRNWQERPGGFDVDIVCRFRFPEGEFIFNATAIGMDDPDSGSRIWQLFYARSGMDGAKTRFTKLGALVLQLQFDSFTNLKTWYAKMLESGSASLEPMIRLEGNVPPNEKRAVLAKELLQPNSINTRPGGPMKPLGLANVVFADDKVYFTHLLEVMAASLGGEVGAVLTVELKGDDLVKEMLTLAGPGWQQQPYLTDLTPFLTNYKFQLVPITLDIRPSIGRLTPRPTPALTP